jgi:hypothetical protein
MNVKIAKQFSNQKKGIAASFVLLGLILVHPYKVKVNAAINGEIMKKKVRLGLILGLIAGIIDVIPMVIQDLTWDANLSAFTMWLVIGFFLVVTDTKVRGAFKGMIISFLVLLPNLFIIGSNNLLTLIPIIIITAILGALIGFIFDRMKE